jgi:hypothetical protein
MISPATMPTNTTAPQRLDAARHPSAIETGPVAPAEMALSRDIP